MLMADTMAIFFVVVGMMMAFSGLWLLCRGLWSNQVAEAKAVCDKGLIKSFLVGLPLTFLMVVAVIITANLLGSIGKITAVGIVCIYIVYSGLGIAGLTTIIGERLTSKIDEEQQWRATLRGCVVLVFSYLFPLLGWFVIIPASHIIGCGATTISIVKKAASLVFSKPILIKEQTAQKIEAVPLSVNEPIGTRQ